MMDEMRQERPDCHRAASGLFDVPSPKISKSAGHRPLLHIDDRDRQRPKRYPSEVYTEREHW
jgi:hypothetical protein